MILTGDMTVETKTYFERILSEQNVFRYSSHAKEEIEPFGGSNFQCTQCGYMSKVCKAFFENQTNLFLWCVIKQFKCLNKCRNQLKTLICNVYFVKKTCVFTFQPIKPLQGACSTARSAKLAVACSTFPWRSKNKLLFYLDREQTNVFKRKKVAFAITKSHLLLRKTFSANHNLPLTTFDGKFDD